MIKNVIRMYGIADSIGFKYKKASMDIEQICNRIVSSDNSLAILIFGSISDANKELKKRCYKKTISKMLIPFDVLR